MGVEIAVAETSKSVRVCAVVAGVTAMGKRVAVGVTNDLCGCVASGEATLAAGIAPGAVRVPVPCLQVGFGVFVDTFRAAIPS